MMTYINMKTCAQYTCNNGGKINWKSVLIF